MEAADLRERSSFRILRATRSLPYGRTRSSSYSSERTSSVAPSRPRSTQPGEARPVDSAPSGSAKSLIMQIIDLQIDLVRALGLSAEASETDFGVPTEAVSFPADVASNPNHKPPGYKPTPQYSNRVEEEFCHNDAYIKAAADSKAAAKESRKVHRGTVGDFLFGDSNATAAVVPTDLAGAPMPPPPAYQVTPHNIMAQSRTSRYSRRSRSCHPTIGENEPPVAVIVTRRERVRPAFPLTRHPLLSRLQAQHDERQILDRLFILHEATAALLRPAP